MAWASLGSTGSTQSKTLESSFQSGLDVSANVGDVIFITIAKDNISTTDGNTNEVTGVTDVSGNTWTKVREYTNSRGAAAGGTTVALFYSQITTQITSGASKVTVQLSANVTAKAASLWGFSVGSGNTVSVSGTATDVKSVSAVTPSQTISSLTSQEYLFFRGVAAELTSFTFSPTTNYTAIGANLTAGGTTATNMAVCGEFRILSATGDTASGSFSAADSCGIYLAFKEASSAINATGTDSFASTSAITSGLSEASTATSSNAHTASITSGLSEASTGSATQASSTTSGSIGVSETATGASTQASTAAITSGISESSTGTAAGASTSSGSVVLSYSPATGTAAGASTTAATAGVSESGTTSSSSAFTTTITSGISEASTGTVINAFTASGTAGASESTTISATQASTTASGTAGVGEAASASASNAASTSAIGGESINATASSAIASTSASTTNISESATASASISFTSEGTDGTEPVTIATSIASTTTAAAGISEEATGAATEASTSTLQGAVTESSIASTAIASSSNILAGLSNSLSGGASSATTTTAAGGESINATISSSAAFPVSAITGEGVSATASAAVALTSFIDAHITDTIRSGSSFGCEGVGDVILPSVNNEIFGGGFRIGRAPRKIIEPQREFTPLPKEITNKLTNHIGEARSKLGASCGGVGGVSINSSIVTKLSMPLEASFDLEVIGIISSACNSLEPHIELPDHDMDEFLIFCMAS